MAESTVIDLRKMDEMCGDPGVSRVTDALATAEPGDMILVITDSRDLEFTASAWAKKHGHDVQDVRREGRVSYLSIRRA